MRNALFGFCVFLIDIEVLTLPSTYVPRRLKFLIPKSPHSPTSTSTACSSSTSSSSSSQQGTSSSTRYASTPDYYDDPSLYTTLQEKEVLNSPQSFHFSCVYALPAFGSTCLMVSLIVQIQQDHPDRWVSYMDLRKVARFIEQIAAKGDVDVESWNLATLTSAYNKITSPLALKQIEEFFTGLVDGVVDTECQEIKAELFLDELDEVSLKTQDILLKIISRQVSSPKSKARVWLCSRHHLKPKLERYFPQANVYELLPLLRNEQIDLLANYWKLSHCPNVADSKLKNFASGLHDQMEKLIPNFYKTIGACPSHLLQLPDFFTHLVTKLEDLTENHFSTVEVSVAKVFEKFMLTKLDAYLDKISCEQPTLAMSSLQFREKELRKLERLHVKAIISSYPKFKCDAKILFATTGNQAEQAHELYRVGICYEVNGEMRFIHQMYAEFLLAQYFVDSGRLKNTSNLYISFFLNNILFDDECKGTRKFFDAYLLIQQKERNKIRDVMVWNRLRCFLIKHYRLNAEAEASTASSENDDGDDKAEEKNGNNEERNPKLTYNDIKNNGSIVHLCIMEGHLKIFNMILNSFKGYPNELKKLLSITVPLEIYNENPFAKPDSTFNPEIHVVSPFQMLAMFGFGAECMEKSIAMWFHCFGTEYMMKYFEDGTWTVLHYAAMNSNCHFLHGLFAKDPKWIEFPVNHRNPEGQQPIHMVLTKCWYYSIKIKDHPHPDFKEFTALSSSSALSSLAKAKAIEEAINAVSAPCLVPCTAPAVTSSSTAMTGELSAVVVVHAPSKRRQLGKKSAAPPTTSKEKCSRPIKKACRRRSSQNQVVKVFKDIWCFEGIDKHFLADWDFYPEDMECSPLRPHLLTFKLLLENGADVNAQEDVDEKTVLHQASVLESVKIVEYLLSQRADINLRDDLGKTPVQYAALHENMNVLEVLSADDKEKSVRRGNDGFAGDAAATSSNGPKSSMVCNVC